MAFKRFNCIFRAQSDTNAQAASTLASGGNTEQMVQQIMEMGGGSWDKETVTRALRAAYNNPERAVDYLYSVCPSSLTVSYECCKGMKLLKFVLFFFRGFLKEKLFR